jgi:hypothetical protein
VVTKSGDPVGVTCFRGFNGCFRGVGVGLIGRLVYSHKDIQCIQCIQ